MVSVHDVAAYIEVQLGPLSPYKLQKLVFYAQAWSLVWDRRPLFDEVLKAWRHGPVSPELRHERVKTNVRTGRPEILSSEARQTIDAVLSFYGPMSPQDLIELSHRETPWRAARALGRDSPVITHMAMREYYGPLAEPGIKRIPDSVAAGIRLLLATPQDATFELLETDDIDGAAVQSWLETGEDDPWEGSFE